MNGRPKILVIKLGALGDVVQAGGPFAAIRRHHGDAHITLMTTVPFVTLLQQSPWFDEIWVDDRPKIWQLRRWRALKKNLRSAGFDRVYDLQTSDRSNAYYRWLPGGTEWSGIAPGCSLRHDDPNRDLMHTIDRQIGQLAVAGIDDVPMADFGWIRADLSKLGIRGDYALMVPGGSAHRPEKRWPVENFVSLAWSLVRRGITPVVLGGPAEATLGGHIVEACGDAIDLTGRTSLAQIYALALGCVVSVGNDTGPMHLIVLAGRPATVLFSAASDPALCAPRPSAGGGKIGILRREPLAGLSVNEVEAELGLR